MSVQLRQAKGAVVISFALAALSGALCAHAENAPKHEPPAAEVHELALDQQVELAQSMADHEMVAQRFETEAADFEKKAAEHERLAKHYRSGAGVGPKGQPASLATHCERIARNLRVAATDARAMARMHRDVAHKVVK